MSEELNAQLLQKLYQQWKEQNAAEEAVTEHLSPDQLKQEVDTALPRTGKSQKELESILESYLKQAVKTSHPRYFNQLWGGFHEAGLIADFVSSLSNTSMYTHEVAPLATLIEKELIKKMGSLAGFEDPEGQFTTGGSNGNLMAIAMARQHAFPESKESGLQNLPALKIFCSEDAHYSLTKAAQIMGMGSQAIVKVPTDEQGKMKGSSLSELIEQERAQGNHPLMVVATAGTTVKGAFDPLKEIAHICQQEDLWMHVDGAWGGAVLLSKTHRQLMKGLERADSFVWDAHKMMGLSLTCSALIVRERGHMLRTFSTANTDYIFHHAAEDQRDLGPSTMHCGRKNDALKLWLTWQQLGDEGWEQLIDKYMNLASQSEQIIHSSEKLELVSPRAFSNICFRYLPEDPSQSSDINQQIRDELMASGHSMVNKAIIDNETIIRLVICNPFTEKEHIDQFFEEVIRLGDQFSQSGR